MNHRLVFFIFFILVFNRSYGQAWCRIIESDSADYYGYSIIQAQDGSYYITGICQEKGWDADAVVARLDVNGELRWTRTIGGIQSDVGNSIAASSDGGVVIAGTTSAIGTEEQNSFLVKIDSTGTVRWSKTYTGAGFQGFSYVVPSSDGGFVMAGGTRPAGMWNWDVYVVKVDSNGKLEWNRLVGGSQADFGLGLIRTNDDGYAVTGLTESFGSGKRDLYLVKLDRNGDLLWTRTSGESNDDLGTGIVEVADGSFFSTGYKTSVGYSLGNRFDEMIVKVRESGDPEWSFTLSDAVSSIYGRSILLTRDGKIITVGDQVTGTRSKIHLAKLDQSGNLYWHRVYAFHDTLDATGWQVINTNEGGYAIVGTTSLKDYKNHWGILFLKLDPEGNMCSKCFQGEGLGSVTDYGKTGSGGTAASTGEEQDIQFTSGTNGKLVTICPVTGNDTLPDLPGAFNAYPTPCHNEITFQYFLEASQTVRLDFINIYGQYIYDMEIELKAGKGTFQEDISFLSSGLYLVRVRSLTEGKNLATLRIIKL
jgi:hypothetical protein